jgi:uncharacterized protein (TIGR03437 family)
MQNVKTRWCGAMAGAALSVFPAVLVGFPTGAPPARTGAPGETTCVVCHVGTPLNGGGGSLQVTFSGGTTYSSTQTGQFTVTINDPVAKVYGFEASTRRANDNSQAGAISIVTTDTQIEMLNNIQYITHTTPHQSNVFRFAWTAPDASAGDVRIFVSGNAANGDGTNKGDHIYNTSITLSAPGSTPSRPVIAPGGVIDALDGQAGLSSSNWISIYGYNFTTGNRGWQVSDFVQDRLPQTLDDVSVTINGKPALISYISPAQINVLPPTDDATGNVAIVVKNSNGQSDPVSVIKTATLPALYAPFALNSQYFVTVVDSLTGQIYGKPTIEPRASRGMHPGDSVEFFASGLGATNPALPNEQLIKSPAATTTTWTILINNVPVQQQSQAYLVAPGLYQINGVIPQLPPGDYPIALQGGGAQSSKIFATISQ